MSFFIDYYKNIKGKHIQKLDVISIANLTAYALTDPKLRIFGKCLTIGNA